jgi:ubiquinone/menaquinone biosynthesis C-methylase UbiE
MTDTNPWGYMETTLAERIAVHDRYARYEINDWILAKLDLRPGEKVLDIGCGNGKQALLYARIVGPAGEVQGIDISDELLREAGEAAARDGLPVFFSLHDANDPLPFPDGLFDAISCCFSIYYYTDIPGSLAEMRRVLREGGRIFIAGPTVENAREMISVYEEATGSRVPQRREERMRDEIIPAIERCFGDVTVEVFENPVEFPDTETFLGYFSTTLHFKELMKDAPDAKERLGRVKEISEGVVARDGSFTVTKRVYGILGRKRVKAR